MKLDFIGTSLTVDIEGSADITYSIDGTKTTLKGAGGEVLLAENLEKRRHKAVVTITNANGTNGIKSFETDTDGAILKNADTKKYIQFIGDSITTDSRSYSYKIPETYGYDYSIISTNGIALQDGAGWYYGSFEGLTYKDCVGIESAYFKTKNPRNAYVSENGKWQYVNPDFDTANDHKPDVIVIGLGTNDNGFINGGSYPEISADTFTESYVEFVRKLNTIYPDAEIYILRQFNNVTDNGSGVNLSEKYDVMRNATVNAVNILSSIPKVHYIDTSEWYVPIRDDDTHPTQWGYEALRDLVYNEIKASLE